MADHRHVLVGHLENRAAFAFTLLLIKLNEDLICRLPFRLPRLHGVSSSWHRWFIFSSPWAKKSRKKSTSRADHKAINVVWLCHPTQCLNLRIAYFPLEGYGLGRITSRKYLLQNGSWSRFDGDVSLPSLKNIERWMYPRHASVLRKKPSGPLKTITNNRVEPMKKLEVPYYPNYEGVEFHFPFSFSWVLSIQLVLQLLFLP